MDHFPLRILAEAFRKLSDAVRTAADATANALEYLDDDEYENREDHG